MFSSVANTAMQALLQCEGDIATSLQSPNEHNVTRDTPSSQASSRSNQSGGRAARAASPFRTPPPTDQRVCPNAQSCSYARIQLEMVRSDLLYTWERTFFE